MAVAQCSVCGQVLPAAEAAPGSAAVAESSALNPTCDSCRQKLSSEKPHARTTILRPRGSLKVEGQSILAPAPEPEAETEGWVLNEPGGRENDSSVALRIGAEPAPESTDPNAQILTKQFGSYEILGEISRGSFGVVYKGRQQGLDRIVALKVLLAGVHASPEAVARFQREARAVAKLKHPNIVPVYDIGTHEGHHFFAMEFVEGHALSDLIAKQKVSISDAMAIAEALADAAESAHQASVIHRDIKPSNILVDRAGSPHITDFGLAKQIDLDTKYTVSGTTLGTPAYMPPEQARGEIDKTGARSDVYSIGAVLYEMLTGRTPFGGRSLLEVVVAVINDPVPPPRQINPKIHRDIQTIVLKCLEKDARRRYESAAALRDDLRRFRSGEAIRAKPAGPFLRAARKVRRHALVLGAVAAVLAVMAVSYLRIKRSETTVDKKVHEQVAQKLAEIEDKKKQVEWRPDWWFPLKNLAELPPEQAARYKKQDERREAFQGLVKGKDAPDLSGNLAVTCPAANILVSPDSSPFCGDVDFEFVFKLDEAGARNGVRAGLQSLAREFEGQPFLMDCRNGVMSVIGPAGLYACTNPPDGTPSSRRAVTRPKLELKADKASPPLIPGQYTLRIRREGILISFTLTGPEKDWVCGIELKDTNLSSWVFKNTQFALRTPVLAGITPVSAEARARFGGDDDLAFYFFNTGSYYEAVSRLKVLQDGTDSLLKARALLTLGLIEEVWHAGQSPAAGLYSEALRELDKLRDPKLAAERSRLALELQFRRAIGYAKSKQWAAFKEELKTAWPDNGEKIAEPLVWELQPVLCQVLDLPEKELSDTALKLGVGMAIFQRLGLPPSSSKFSEYAKSLAMSLKPENRAEILAQIRELEPRNPDAALLKPENRIEAMIALHGAYPAPALDDVFIETMRQSAKENHISEAERMLLYLAGRARTPQAAEKYLPAGGWIVSAAIRLRKYAGAGKIIAALHSPRMAQAAWEELDRQSKDAAGEDFEQFRTALLPAMTDCLTDDPVMAGQFSAAMEKLALAIVAGGRISDLVKLHETLRGPQAASDSRLAGAFAAAIRKLAESPGPEAGEQALGLLRYCAQHVAVNDPALQKAAVALCRPKKEVVDEQRSYGAILTVQQAYAAPELVECCLNVIRELLKRQRFEEVILFYSQARAAFRSDAACLTPSLLSALDSIHEEDQRMRMLETVARSVQGEFEERKDEAAARHWRLEHADILLALNQWERAREIYAEFCSTPGLEPVLLGKASLRLAALGEVHPDTVSAGDVLLPLLTMANLPEEFKVAARLLAAPDQLRLENLDAQLRGLGVPLVLNEGEWDLLRALRLRQERNYTAALAALQDADRKGSRTRVWVHTFASQLARTAPRSPDESQPPKDKGPEIQK